MGRDSRFAIATLALVVGVQPHLALAACGDRGGPGYRGPDGRCVGWADIGRTRGNPPTTRCTAENASAAASVAAEHGVKAIEAGASARDTAAKRK